MKEYIMKFGDGLLNEETGEVVFQPEVVGELTRCENCKYAEQESQHLSVFGQLMLCTLDRKYKKKDGYCDAGKDKK